MLNEDGVAIPLCAAAPGAEGREQRAFGLLVLASCFFQGTPGRFLTLGASKVRRLSVCFPGFMYSLGPWYTLWLGGMLAQSVPEDLSVQFVI